MNLARGMHILHFRGPVGARSFSPEQRLWAAVLRQAFLDLDSSREPIRKAAREWFEGEGEELGTLTYITTILDMDRENVRRASMDPERIADINVRFAREWNGGRQI